MPMIVFSRNISIVSEGAFHAQNITEQVCDVIRESAVQEGIALVFYQHTTGAVIVAEHEAGMLVDLEKVLEKITPANGNYMHHLRGYDANGSSHLRAALLDTSVTVPISGGDLDLGSYQEILVIDFDEGMKERTLAIKILGV